MGSLELRWEDNLNCNADKRRHPPAKAKSSSKRRGWLLGGCAAAALIMSGLLWDDASASLAQPASVTPEAIFADATRYTVRIRTSIRWPLGLDQAGSGNGAGFLIDRQKGWILTNAHVAGRSPASIEVAFKDHSFVGAKPVFVDSHLDIAVIAIESATIPAEAQEARMACDREAFPGTPVGAFGHPWSLRFTATRGIVSGKRYLEGTESLQTDAALNPGNSGGPLINMLTGEILGVSAAKFSKDSSEGIGFAVPAVFVCRILKQLHAGKEPSPPVIGAAFVESDQREELVVAQPLSKTWSELKAGDRIVAVDGDRSIRNPSQLIHALRGREGPVVLTLRRDGQPHEVTITLVREIPLIRRQGIIVSGMLISEPWKRDASQTNPNHRLIVDYVEDASLADIRRVQGGDLLWLINGRNFSSLDELFAYLDGPEQPKKLHLLLRRRSGDPMATYEFHETTVDIEDLRKLRQTES